MPQIALKEDNLVLDAAVCPKCPGGFKIYPASALDAHIAQHERRDRNGWFNCVDCDEPFHHVFNEDRKRPSMQRCGACRTLGGGGLKKAPNIGYGIKVGGSRH